MNPDCISVTVKHNPSKMFWGCFSWNGLEPIVPLNSSVTGKTHAETIQKYVVPTLQKYFPYGNRIFQEDNITSYHLKVAATACKNVRIMMLLWSAQSSDLNSIENL